MNQTWNKNICIHKMKLTWKLFSSQISVKDITIEVKIDEYFDNTNSSDDNEEDSIGEAGRRN